MPSCTAVRSATAFAAFAVFAWAWHSSSYHRHTRAACHRRIFTSVNQYFPGVKLLAVPLHICQLDNLCTTHGQCCSCRRTSYSVCSGPVKSLCFKRMQLLEAKFKLYVLLNGDTEQAAQKSVPHRDFYNVRKVSVRSSASFFATCDQGEASYLLSLATSLHIHEEHCTVRVRRPAFEQVRTSVHAESVC